MFYFGITVNLQKCCKDTTEFHILPYLIPLILIFEIYMVYLSESVNYY